MKRKTFSAALLPVKRTRINKKHNRRDKVKKPAIVEVECSDNLSLFCAVRVGMFYYEKGGGKWEPAEHYSWSDRLKRDAESLSFDVGVPLQQTSYGFDNVKKVYEYLKKRYPEMYRVLVFSETSHTRAVYNSGNNARHNICLYQSDDHFDLIKAPQKFFRKKYYCVDCEQTYVHLKGHSKCKIRCHQCFRVGYGYPCKGDLRKDLECPDCHKFFPSQDCMDAHKPCSCNTYHRCVYCNVQYRLRPQLENKGHRCSKKVADIAARTLLTLPEQLEKDNFSCATTAYTRLTRHGGVQQDIRSYLAREISVF